MELHAIKRDDIPAFASNTSPAAQALAEFLESNAEAVEITGLPYGLNSVASTLRTIITKNRLPVQVMQRQKRLFLVRKEEEGKE